MTEPSTTDIQQTEKNIEAPKQPWLIWAALGALTIALLTWALLTPPGLLGHADAVGYAVCHRIAVRSFSLNGRPMPLCARCTGAFLGVLIGGWRDFAVMLATGAILVGLVLTEQPVILYLLALFSVAGVLAALTTINTTMVTLLVGRESAARTLWEALPVILLGLTTSLVEVGVIDALRYLAFGSWEGFTFSVAQ